MGPKYPYNPGEDFIKRFTIITISSHLPVYDTVINIISDGEYGSVHSAADSLESLTFSSCLQNEPINSIKSQTRVSAAALEILPLFFPHAVIRCLF